MEYQELDPPPSLAALVRCIWTLDGIPADAGQDPVFPDGSPEVILNFADPFRAIGPDGAVVDQPLAMLVGQITAPFMVYPGGRARLVGLRLYPFGGGAFTADMSAITNTWTALDVAWPVRIPDNASIDKLVEVALATISPLVDRGRKPHPHVIASCEAIRNARGNVALDELAAALGTTSRTLQRRFASEVGIGPKLLARITRFQHVFAAWRDDPGSLARVAADCGYFDQSHLVRDFRDFAGEAPAAALTGQPTFTAFFLP